MAYGSASIQSIMAWQKIIRSKVIVRFRIIIYDEAPTPSHLWPRLSSAGSTTTPRSSSSDVSVHAASEASNMMRMLLLGILCMVLITEYSGMKVDNCNNIYVLSGHLISAIIQEYNNDTIIIQLTITIQ